MSVPNASTGHLSECLIESDAEAIVRGRRLRRKALALSLVLEAAIVAGLLAWPLLAPATLTAHYISIPVPPYRRGASDKPRVAPHAPVQRPAITQIMTQPPVIPPHVDMRPEPAPAIDTASPWEGDANLNGYIPGVDGGMEPPVEVRLPQPPRSSARPAAEPHKVSAGVMEAKLIDRVQPEYPAAAKVMRISGSVKLRAIISADGRVKELTVLSGNPILARSAIAAVSQWRYRPTLLSGQPVEVETLITVNFVLE